MRFIKKARLKTRKNQKDFGEALEVSQSRVSDWESGVSKVPAKHLVKICALTKAEITVEQLLSDHDYKEAT